MTTATGAELIEGYLRARQVRYFRGHHDDEYFLMINAYPGRLHVHLKPCPRDATAARISVTAERYYPVTQWPRVTMLADRWNAAGPRAIATVVESSDPRLVGVLAESRYRSADAGSESDFGVFVDETIQSAVDLFGRMSALGAQAHGQRLLDAG
ncbi:hypothetical protein ACXDF8_03035 [Mycolicibacterium sp. CBM1]